MRMVRGLLRLAGVATALWLAAPATGAVYGDFNGDGFADLAVGVPGQDIDGVTNTGSVNVLYGSRSGLTAAGDQLWHQNTPGVPDSNEDHDNFGGALAVGDFDADGFADLAVGAPNEDVGTAPSVLSAGAVTVLYGSPTGLADDRAQFWHQNTAGIVADPEGAQFAERFGRSLASANFGRGAAADLVVGVSESFPEGSAGLAGAVHVIYGSAAGLTTNGNQFWHQNVAGVVDEAESQDNFGASLAAADFGKGSQADLAVGVPQEDVGAVGQAGAVHVLYGSAAGLTSAGDRLWHQDGAGILDSAEEDDFFGFSVAAGNLGKSSTADLAIGVSLENIGTTEDAGAVSVLYGTARGLSATGDQLWHRGRTGIAGGGLETDAEFGTVVAVANMGKGSTADLAVGVPFEDIGTVVDAGAVNVLYGSASGLAKNGDQFWHQDTPGVEDTAGSTNEFGASLAGANFGKGATADLAIGIPNEIVVDVVPIGDAGAVTVLYGSSNGLTARGDQFWHRLVAGVMGDSEFEERFGSALAPRR
jgi:disulfide bond formation protein DsbB